jgi:uncharacterized Fe-S cluster-containing radical SAM superfamily protein
LLDASRRRLLLTNYLGTEQERDLSESPNCNGFGRIRHFRRQTSPGWVPNPIPIDPASRALGLGSLDELRAQLFQNAGCNWRCWYCFVPFDLLSASERYSSWLSVGEMLDLTLREPCPPAVIVLSGGEPELTPEWIPWLLKELEKRDLTDRFYVWSDDNLSTDYFWTALSPSDQEFVARHPLYGRACCFKGFDEASFAYNTNATEDQFAIQFQLMNRLIQTGIDVYAYVTLTTPEDGDLRDPLRRFLDRLQKVDENLPLRTVPLEVRPFTPVQPRLTDVHRSALKNQWRAIEVWQRELAARFPVDLRTKSITEVAFASRH